MTFPRRILMTKGRIIILSTNNYSRARQLCTLGGRNSTTSINSSISISPASVAYFTTFAKSTPTEMTSSSSSPPPLPSSSSFQNEIPSIIMKPSQLLKNTLPQLRQRFQEKSKEDKKNNTSIFPLFPQRYHDAMWKQVHQQQKEYHEQQLQKQQQQEKEKDDKQSSTTSSSGGTNKKRNRHAAVLVPLLCHQGIPSLLFTTRSSHMPTHADEVSFPGGHYDIVSDTTLMDTALREMREELLPEKEEAQDLEEDVDDVDDDLFFEYPWKEIEIIGKTTAIPSIRGTPVTAVLAVLPHDILVSDIHTIFPGNPKEVENVFCVSLAELIQVETHQRSERFQADIPVYGTKAGHTIWGLTAVIVKPILSQLLQPVFALPKKKKQSNNVIDDGDDDNNSNTVTLPPWSKL